MAIRDYRELPNANCLRFLEEEIYEKKVPTGKTFSFFFFVFGVSIGVGNSLSANVISNTQDFSAGR